MKEGFQRIYWGYRTFLVFTELRSHQCWSIVVGEAVLSLMWCKQYILLFKMSLRVWIGFNSKVRSRSLLGGDHSFVSKASCTASAVDVPVYLWQDAVLGCCLCACAALSFDNIADDSWQEAIRRLEFYVGTRLSLSKSVSFLRDWPFHCYCAVLGRAGSLQVLHNEIPCIGLHFKARSDLFSFFWDLCLEVIRCKGSGFDFVVC